MRALLSSQRPEVLEFWLDKRGVTRSHNPVSDIIVYYQYMEVLMNSTPNTPFIFDNEVVVSTIVSHCNSYVRHLLRCVNHLFRRVVGRQYVHSMRDDIHDAVSTFDWRVITIMYQSPRYVNGIIIMEAAKFGVKIAIPGLTMPVLSTREEILMQIVTESSDGSEKYLVLFKELCSSQRRWSDLITSSQFVWMVCGCAKSGDGALLEFILTEYRDLIVRGNSNISYAFIYYGRVDFIRKFPYLISRPKDEMLTYAYCSGNYEEMSKVLVECNIITDNIRPHPYRMLTIIDTARTLGFKSAMKTKNLDLFTSLVRDSLPSSLTFESIMHYLSCMEYSLEELRRFWEVVVTERGFNMHIVLQYLLPLKKYESIHFIITTTDSETRESWKNDDLISHRVSLYYPYRSKEVTKWILALLDGSTTLMIDEYD